MKIIRYLKDHPYIEWDSINGCLVIVNAVMLAIPIVAVPFVPPSEGKTGCYLLVLEKSLWFWGIYIFLFWSEETKELIKQSFKRIHKFLLTESEKYRNFESDEKDN